MRMRLGILTDSRMNATRHIVGRNIAGRQFVKMGTHGFGRIRRNTVQISFLRIAKNLFYSCATLRFINRIKAAHPLFQIGCKNTMRWRGCRGFGLTREKLPELAKETADVIGG